ncbi:hypothetical protein FGO68_gene7172 [Halteria grandinella]|uniref:Uncharacterized protein n=1 Tax=Halteria grandinella TaxID=5974 RepID=A0A8J8P151_HALGN|nr:hypothetical protein FGO68_gene7172 [Halteria grandinella]
MSSRPSLPPIVPHLSSTFIQQQQQTNLTSQLPPRSSMGGGPRQVQNQNHRTTPISPTNNAHHVRAGSQDMAQSNVPQPNLANEVKYGGATNLKYDIQYADGGDMGNNEQQPKKENYHFQNEYSQFQQSNQIAGLLGQTLPAQRPVPGSRFGGRPQEYVRFGAPLNINPITGAPLPYRQPNSRSPDHTTRPEPAAEIQFDENGMYIPQQPANNYVNNNRGSTPGFKVPNTIDSIDHARYLNRLNQATFKQNVVYNKYLQDHGWATWSPDEEKEKIIARQKQVPENHIFQQGRPSPSFEQEQIKRSLGRHFGQVEMNDPLIRSQLKNFLDQQIQEKHMKKLEDREHDRPHLGGHPHSDPTSDNMIREMQVMRQQHLGTIQQYTDNAQYHNKRLSTILMPGQVLTPQQMSHLAMQQSPQNVNGGYPPPPQRHTFVGNEQLPPMYKSSVLVPSQSTQQIPPGYGGMMGQPERYSLQTPMNNQRMSLPGNLGNSNSRNLIK